MSAASAPKCRLCAKEHWQREGCDFSGKKRMEVLEYAKAVINREVKKAVKKKAAKKKKGAKKK